MFPAALCPGPARAAADCKLVEPDRKARLKDLRIGQPAVGHMRLNRAGPIVVRPRAGAAGNRLIILVRRIAEGEIVHRPLARREPAGRREHHGAVARQEPPHRDPGAAEVNLGQALSDL